MTYEVILPERTAEEGGFPRRYPDPVGVVELVRKLREDSPDIEIVILRDGNKIGSTELSADIVNWYMVHGKPQWPWIAENIRFCFYLFADALGFADLIDSLPSATVANRMRAVRRDLDRIKESTEQSSAKWNLGTGPGDSTTSDQQRSVSFGYELISDTIIFYAKDVSESTLSSAYSAFLDGCSMLYISLLCEHALILRGVVSASREYIAEPGLFLAPSLGRSHEIEKLQNWGGIAVDADQITYQCGPVMPQESIIFPCYLVPLKSNALGSAYILNVVTRASVELLRTRKLSLSTVIEGLEERARGEHLPKHVSEKLKNTVKYLSLCSSWARSGGWL